MKNIRNLCWLTAVCLLLGGCALLSGGSDPVKKLCADVGLNMNAAQVLSDDDSHGGFHGDGMRLAVLRFDGAADEALLQSVEGWQPMPLDGVMDETLYTRIEGIYPSGARIPRVEHGYWYFRDRASDTSQPFAARYSYNFTAAIWDADTNTLYYCEVDT